MRTSFRKNNAEVRLSAHQGAARRWNVSDETTKPKFDLPDLIKQLSGSANYKLKAISKNSEFIDKLAFIIHRYMQRKPQDINSIPEIDEDRELFKLKRQQFKDEHVYPSLADAKKTLIYLSKQENKVQALYASRPLTNPVISTLGKSATREQKLTGQDYAGLVEQIKILARRQTELQTTPKDHPSYALLVEHWEAEHKPDFEQLNNVLIPGLIESALAHLKTVYIERLHNSNSEKRRLALNLAITLNYFGLKPSQSKDGILCDLLIIVGDVLKTPISQPHKLLDGKLIAEAKKPRSQWFYF